MSDTLQSLVQDEQAGKEQPLITQRDSRYRPTTTLTAKIVSTETQRGYIFWYNQRWCDYTGTNLEQANCREASLFVAALLRAKKPKMLYNARRLSEATIDSFPECSIISEHGGRLWATANDTRGATFQFTLPARS